MNLPTFHIPSIGPRQGKVWGTTQLVFARETVEAHSLKILKGGYCSIHLHESKWNRFLLISGQVEVIVFHGDDRKDITLLSPGQIADVAPGQRHQFRALTDSEMIEIYWVNIDASDINRGGTEGGLSDGGL